MTRSLFQPLFVLVMFFGTTFSLYAQTPFPNPTAIFITPNGDEDENTAYNGSAPVTGRFYANVEDLGSYQARYEWRIYQTNSESPLINRFDEVIEYTFTQSGTFYVQLYATFVQGNDTIQYPEEGETDPFILTISESRLEAPNAFSPNGDGINDIYKVKDNYQSIISFRATIFNRWGQRLYSWSDLDGGWDGTFDGKPVKDGVYFVLIEARGADGKKYSIKKDVNILRGYNNSPTTP